MIDFRGYKAEDFAYIEDSVEPLSAIAADESEGAGIAITAFDGEAMACGGIVYTDDGGVAWMKISKKCRNNAYSWARAVKEVFRLMVESVDIPVSTYVLKGFCIGDKLARSIGMKNTGIEKEHNGKTYFKYTVI